MQVIYVFFWKIFVFLLCEISHQYQYTKGYRSNTNYVSRAAQLGCPNIYSLNRDRSRHNPQLTAVSDIISKYYNYSEIKVLDLAYVGLPKKAPLPSSSINGFLAQPRFYLKKVFNRKKAQKKAVYKYKHLIGTLK